MSSFKTRRALIYIALIAVALTWELLPQKSMSAPATSFEVASWNMRWFPSGYMERQSEKDEKKRLSQAARLMRQQSLPDILLVQEIRDMETCRALAEQLDDKAFRPVVCSSFIDYESQEPALQQLAIFSRYKALVAGYEPWHVADFVYPPRGYAFAVFEIGGQLVACFNVHLKSNYIPEGQDLERQATLNRLKRELSARQILDRIELFQREGVKGRPVASFIVAGDFNTSLFDKTYHAEATIRSMFDAGFSNAHEGLVGDAYATLPANQYYPAATFDYILYNGLLPVGKAQVLPEVWISDHREIRAEFNVIK